MAGDDEPSTASGTTVDKALAVLAAIAMSPEGLTMVDVARQMGLERSAVQRIVAALRRRDLVRRCGRPPRLVPGDGLHLLAWGPAPDLRLVAEPTLAALVSLTGESASLSIRYRTDFYCVAHRASPHELRYSPIRGTRYPLNSGAAGLAIWASLPPADRDELLAAHRFPSFTVATKTGRDELAAELGRTAERGYAVSEGVRTPGGCSIAVPVLDRHGTVAAALAISAAVQRLPPTELVRYVPDLRDEARSLRRAMGWQA